MIFRMSNRELASKLLNIGNDKTTTNSLNKTPVNDEIHLFGSGVKLLKYSSDGKWMIQSCHDGHYNEEGRSAAICEACKEILM